MDFTFNYLLMTIHVSHRFRLIIDLVFYSIKTLENLDHELDAQFLAHLFYLIV